MKHYIFIVLLFGNMLFKAQQDAQYNLYQFNPILINPAYAGAKDVLSVNASVRNQWSGFDGAPRTACLSGHMPLMKKNIGVGMTIISDKMGPRNVTGAYANFAYILKLDRKTKLSFGLGAGYNRYQFNYNKLSFISAEVPVDLSQTQNHGALDINAGVYLKGSTYFAGLSASHLTKPSLYEFADGNSNNFAYRLRNHLFFTAGKAFVIDDNVVFAPTILVKNVTNTTSFDINFNVFLYQKVWVGLFLRGGYGPGFLAQYYVSNKLKIGYSYDTGLKDARRLGAAHEVMIGFDFSGSKVKTINPRFL